MAQIYQTVQRGELQLFGRIVACDTGHSPGVLNMRRAPWDVPRPAPQHAPGAVQFLETVWKHRKPACLQIVRMVNASQRRLLDTRHDGRTPPQEQWKAI